MSMGYNGNNRKLKTDMFPKRSISKKDLGLVLSPLLVPLLIASDAKKNISKEEISKSSVTSIVGVVFCSIFSAVILIPGTAIIINSFTSFWTIFGVILTIICFLIWIYLVIGFVDDYKASKTKV